jgi:hypothetical protein
MDLTLAELVTPPPPPPALPKRTAKNATAHSNQMADADDLPTPQPSLSLSDSFSSAQKRRTSNQTPESLLEPTDHSIPNLDQSLRSGPDEEHEQASQIHVDSLKFIQKFVFARNHLVLAIKILTIFRRYMYNFGHRRTRPQLRDAYALDATFSCKSLPDPRPSDSLLFRLPII